ncbi:histidine--tRNA ligase [bacterium]|nr:histidine--tRNA ligase [bacterium]
MKTYKLTTQPYKGTNDYYPKDMYKRNILFDIWKETAIEFGYEEYDTPLLEEADLYRAKSGEELANTQLYNFTDKGGREVAIRPEMTPSLARMVAARINELPKPIRWFNIGKYYRYEKPQRGRTREFFQLNIDILGLETINAEVEIFQFINRVMEKLKAPKESWCIYMNNRYLMDYFFNEVLNVSDDLKPKLSRAIDNYTKLEAKDFKEYLKDFGMDKKQVDSLLKFLKSTSSDLAQLAKVNKGAKDLSEILAKCDALGITNVQFKPYIMRGIAYYTGTVIELFDVGSKDNPRALFGGGRYDDLLTIFNKPTIPAFGLGWGNITTENFIETYNLFPTYKSSTQVYVTLGDIGQLEGSSLVALALRKRGVKVEQQLKVSNLARQIEYASKKGIPYVLFVNDAQIEIKNLEKGTQKRVSIDEIVKIV